MAKAKVVNSTDGVTVIFNGDKRYPEPTTGVIKFPGGHVEVSRCSDGTYWAHIAVTDGSDIVAGRIDRSDRVDAVESMDSPESINHIAIRIARKIG
jgi:hypothetical protein